MVTSVTHNITFFVVEERNFLASEGFNWQEDRQIATLIPFGVPKRVVPVKSDLRFRFYGQ